MNGKAYETARQAAHAALDAGMTRAEVHGFQGAGKWEYFYFDEATARGVEEEGSFVGYADDIIFGDYE